MRDADLAEGVPIGKVGDRVHLLGGRIAGRAALGLERQGHDGKARHLVIGDRIAEPSGKATIGRTRLREFRRIVVERLIVGIAEARGDLRDHGRVERERSVPDRLPFGVDFLREGFGAKIVNQDLDARLVDVVAPSELVVDAQDRLDVAQEIALGQERLDGLADKRRAAETAADNHLEAFLTGAIAVQSQPDVVHPDRRAIMCGGGDGDLELAREERELRMERQMLRARSRPRCAGPRFHRATTPPIGRS